MNESGQLPTRFEGLLSPELYEHPVDDITVMETHISWILLAGERAYKIKKPVDLGFVDYTKLTDRRRFCQLEVRLNRRLAPELYLSTLVLIQTNAGLILRPLEAEEQLESGATVVDYAICMQRFSQSQLLQHAIPNEQLTADHFERFAEDLARFHDECDQAPDDAAFGTESALREAIDETLDAIDQLKAFRQSVFGRVSDLRERISARLASQKSFFQQRQQIGAIRECHGDLHCGNLLLHDNEIVAFDGIEFNDNLRFIDRLNDLAFLVMDLERNNQIEFAQRLLNRYLEHSGDYEGMAGFSTYVVYRALVRVKVALIRAGQNRDASGASDPNVEEAVEYWTLAEAWLERDSNWLVVTRGLSGSGKSMLSKALMEQSRAIRIRSDVERKRTQQAGSFLSTEAIRRRLDEQGYSSTVSRQVYDRITQLSRGMLKAGFSTIVDATCLRKSQRTELWAAAKALDKRFLILALEADVDVLRRRIEERHRDDLDASDADAAVLDKQLSGMEPFDDSELEHVIIVENGDDLNLDELARTLLADLECDCCETGTPCMEGNAAR